MSQIQPNLNQYYMEMLQTKGISSKQLTKVGMWIMLVGVLVIVGSFLLSGMSRFILESLAGLWFLGLIIVMVGFGVWFLKKGDSQRYSSAYTLSERMGELGFTFDMTAKPKVLKSLKEFDTFHGADHYGANQASGKHDGVVMEVLDHNATYGVGRYRVIYVQLTAYVEAACTQLPDFAILEKGWFDSLKDLSGFTESKLSNRYKIRCDDIDELATHLTSEVVELIVENKLNVECESGDCMIFIKDEKSHEKIIKLAAAVVNGLNGR